jgi:sugar porter (SP) family MFS transporter
LGTALANDPYLFSFFRLIGGIGIGISSVVAPIYISEIATPASRGRLVALYQFNIVFGILVAFVSNYALAGFGGENDWRWMLGVVAVPSILYTLLVFGIAESPRWLITNQNNLAKAKEILQSAGVQHVDEAVDEILSAGSNDESPQSSVGLLNKKHRRLVALAFMIAFFNQLSGINFILYYAPEILEQAGLATRESLFNSIAIGSTNLVFTFVGLYLIDRLGRKTLLLIGSIGYILSLSMVAYAFYTHAGAFFLMSFLLLFIAAHAIGQGAVIWVFISEIFPTRIRSAGQSFGASIHWVFAALITLITPVFLDKESGIFKDNPWPIFAFFAGMMALQLLWVLSRVPETKGISLEELEKKLVGN